MKNLETYNKVVTVGVDFVNDFFPDGSLPVADADLTIPPFNSAADWTRQQPNSLVAFPKEAHPKVTDHFGYPPDYRTTWPEHGIDGTWGAEFRTGLVVTEADVVLKKGMKVNEDAYSGFMAVGMGGVDLESLITPVKHERVAVIIGGLATDYCIKATLLDAQRLATHLFDRDRTLDVYALTDAMRPVNETTGEEALEVIAAEGIRMITSRDLVEGQVMRVEEM
ncbi:MAG TPA: isochorismatase family protein [Candidatus Saccharimonadales bacterium]